MINRRTVDMKAVTRLLIAVLLFKSAARALTWTSTSIQPGSSITVCNGQQTVDLVWSYVDGPSENDNDIVWTFKPNPYTTDSILATVYRGHFFTEPNIHQRVTFLPPSGIQVSGLTPQDNGIYTIKVSVNQFGSLVTHQSSVTVHIADSFGVSNHALRVNKLHDVIYDNHTQEFHVQLSCGTFTSLGNPPVRVFFKTPDNRVLNNTMYENGRFTVNIPNPAVNGDYTCQIANPQDTCLPANSPLLAPATVHVSGCNVQLDVLTANLTTQTQEVQRLRNEISYVEQQLYYERQAHQQCTQQLSHYETTTSYNPQTCSYGRYCDYSNPYYYDTTTYDYYQTTVTPWHWNQYTHQLEVRLVGTNCSAGRLEVRVQGCSNWGAVCSYGWDSSDAHVVCRQLGYSGVLNAFYYNVEWYDPVVMTDVQCNGYEEELGRCYSAYSFGGVSCSYSKVSVSCY